MSHSRKCSVVVAALVSLAVVVCSPVVAEASPSIAGNVSTVAAAKSVSKVTWRAPVKKKGKVYGHAILTFNGHKACAKNQASDLNDGLQRYRSVSIDRGALGYPWKGYEVSSGMFSYYAGPSCVKAHAGDAIHVWAYTKVKSGQPKGTQVLKLAEGYIAVKNLPKL